MQVKARARTDNWKYARRSSECRQRKQRRAMKRAWRSM